MAAAGACPGYRAGHAAGRRLALVAPPEYRPRVNAAAGPRGFPVLRESQVAGIAELERIAARQAAQAATQVIPKVRAFPTIPMSRVADVPALLSPAARLVAAAAVVIWFALGVIVGLHGLG